VDFYKKTIRDIDLKEKTVLVRVDYNVPFERGKISDDYRIKKSLPTIEYLLRQKCKIVLCSHLGKPKSSNDKQFSLKPCAERLSKLIEKNVLFADDCIGQQTQEIVEKMQNSEILLLENLRFHRAEESNGTDFAKQLASLADVFVQDAFGVVHRAHASTVAITKLLPSVAGLLVAKEVATINEVIKNPKRPLMAIIGGAKISDKIHILERFIDIADFVAVGGAMSNTFLLAVGIDVGKSLAEKEEIGLADDIIEKALIKSKKQPFTFYIPQDGVVAKKLDSNARTRIVDWEAHVIASIQNYPSKPPRSSGQVADNEMILDIGPFSGAFIAGGMQLARTVIWNGTMGVTETDGRQGPIGPFAHGTDMIVDAMLGEYGHKPFSVVGGGDTVGYLEEHGLVENFGHVSTGGGASLDLMGGMKLPGVEALLDK